MHNPEYSKEPGTGHKHQIMDEDKLTVNNFT